MDGVDRVEGGGHGPPPSESWAEPENTFVAECTEESGHCQSMCSLV